MVEGSLGSWGTSILPRCQCVGEKSNDSAGAAAQWFWPRENFLRRRTYTSVWEGPRFGLSKINEVLSHCRSADDRHSQPPRLTMWSLDQNPAGCRTTCAYRAVYLVGRCTGWIRDVSTGSPIQLSTLERIEYPTQNRKRPRFIYLRARTSTCTHNT